ncbi:MAG: LON peptidase substrate-binding domain-containing protein [Rhodothermales bacterium]
MAQEFTIPLFPLGMVLYPAEQLSLHIFEPRYREMVADCLETDLPFGIVYTSEGKMAQIGCTARISNVPTRYEDGRMDIVVVGEKRFRVRELFDDRAYLQGRVETVVEPREPLRVDLRERVITQHMRLLELAGRTVRPYLYESDEGISYFIAHNAGLNLDQKQEVLEMLTENERIHFLTRHLESLIPQVEQVEDVRKKVQSNGHFKDFPSGEL